MAHIKLKDLTVNSTIEADLFSDSDSFVRDLSKDELRLQGGCYKIFTIRLPNGKLTTGKVFCNRVIIN